MENSVPKLDVFLRNYIKVYRISQKELAQELGLSPSTLHSYLYGPVPRSFQILLKIAKSLDISTDKLLPGKIEES